MIASNVRSLLVISRPCRHALSRGGAIGKRRTKEAPAGAVLGELAGGVVGVAGRADFDGAEAKTGAAKTGSLYAAIIAGEQNRKRARAAGNLALVAPFQDIR
jgi:hypothetical protein